MDLVETQCKTNTHLIAEILITIQHTVTMQETRLVQIDCIKTEILGLKLRLLIGPLRYVFLRHTLLGHGAQTYTEGYPLQHLFTFSYE